MPSPPAPSPRIPQEAVETEAMTDLEFGQQLRALIKSPTPEGAIYCGRNSYFDAAFYERLRLH